MSNKIDENDEIYQDLKEVGLTRNESLVYVSLLKLGEVGTTKIARDTNLHGQIVYNTLDSLIEKNLVRFSVSKNRKKFIAQNPSIIVGMIDKKKKIADEISKKIEKRFSTIDIQNIEILKGKESFMSNEFKLLNETETDTELLVFGGTGDSFLKTMGNYINEYEFQRKKRGIKVRYLGGEQQRKYLSDSKNDRYEFSYKLLPDVFPGVTNITIFRNRALCINIFDDTTTTIVINDKKIIDSYTGFFESLWSIGK